MRCPVCNHKETKVNDSRVSADGSTVRRRRECAKCGFRFSTVEEIEILDLIVIKRNGHRESYSREKIISGLKRALQKRPHTNEAFLSLIHSVERDIQKKRKHEIKSEEIGEIIMNRLRAFDKVAYIRFASVYRSFEDVESFKKEIEGLTPYNHPRRRGSYTGLTPYNHPRRRGSYTGLKHRAKTKNKKF